MKILWITNIIFPEAVHLLKGYGDLKASGGWMLGAAEALVANENVKLAVATPSKLVEKLERIEGEKIVYYLFPLGKGNLKYNVEYESYWKKIQTSFCPDVVHVHGSEFSHGLAYVNACGPEHVVVSIQGLVSVYARYYTYGLSTLDILRNLTLRDIIKGTLYQQQHSFVKRGKLEVDLLKKVHHIIGRTNWDKAHVWAINPNANYHFCNETLRSEFYSNEKWNYEKCIPHSIFISQGNYPIKGLHQVLKALPLILREYPNTTVRVAGSKAIPTSFFQLMRDTGYRKYLGGLIKHLDIGDHVFFLGPLTAEEMKQEYLSANVFVCPSSIENSPNSLGEAQMLGVPCISSDVGGTMDMTLNSACGNIYRFEEIEMLAHNVCEVFKKESLNTNTQMKRIASLRHDKEINLNQLLTIYHVIEE